MKIRITIILTIILAIGFMAFAEEDGQNPATAIMGDYQDSVSQRMTMCIEPVGEEEADVTIRWGCSVDETLEWHFSGVCSEDGNMMIEYSNCTKKDIIASEDGRIVEKLEYENGTGKLVFDEEYGNPVWTDDQENVGANCVFEYVPLNSITSLWGVEMEDNEAAVLEKMGVPAHEGVTAGLKDLVYDSALIYGHEMEVHFLIGDDAVRAFRIVTHAGNGDVANDISEFMEQRSNDETADLGEEKIKSIGAKYCGITDFSRLGYFDRYAQDGCLMIYIRTSEKDIELLILDQYLQFAEE